MTGARKLRVKFPPWFPEVDKLQLPDIKEAAHILGYQIAHVPGGLNAFLEAWFWRELLLADLALLRHLKGSEDRERGMEEHRYQRGRWTHHVLERWLGTSS